MKSSQFVKSIIASSAIAASLAACGPSPLELKVKELESEVSTLRSKQNDSINDVNKYLTGISEKLNNAIDLTNQNDEFLKGKIIESNELVNTRINDAIDDINKNNGSFSSKLSKLVSETNDIIEGINSNNSKTQEQISQIKTAVIQLSTSLDSVSMELEKAEESADVEKALSQINEIKDTTQSMAKMLDLKIDSKSSELDKKIEKQDLKSEYLWQFRYPNAENSTLEVAFGKVSDLRYISMKENEGYGLSGNLGAVLLNVKENSADANFGHVFAKGDKLVIDYYEKSKQDVAILFQGTYEINEKHVPEIKIETANSEKVILAKEGLDLSSELDLKTGKISVGLTNSYNNETWLSFNVSDLTYNDTIKLIEFD